MTWRAFFLAAAALVLCGRASAQFWETKDYRSWSADECKQMLEDSPWAKKFNALGLQNYRIDYVAQIRSALPVRQAVVRLAQISNHYDQMSPEQKANFDQSAASYLGREYPQSVVIHVEYSSQDAFMNRQLIDYWTNYPERPNTDVYVTAARNERVAAQKYLTRGGGSQSFEFTFPRVTARGPLLAADNKSLKFEFPHPRVTMPVRGVIPEGGGLDRPMHDLEFQRLANRVFFEFDSTKMKLRGETHY